MFLSAASRAVLLAVLLWSSALVAGVAGALAQTVEDAAPFALSGFRSAQFGADEEAVRAAIKADFGLEEDEIQVGLNSVERTRVITIAVPDILPDGGTAQISYIFGYQSKALIQVGLLWATATDPTITDETLYANGEVLRAFFANAGYLPETISRDVVLDNGLLLFRGADAAGHTAILLLQGRFEEAAGQSTLYPAALTLLYAVNPDNPDIFSLKSGDF